MRLQHHTRCVDWNSAEGLETFWRAPNLACWKRSGKDGRAPLGACLSSLGMSTQDAHIEIEAVLANEDVLKPVYISGASENIRIGRTVWGRKIDFSVPQPAQDEMPR